MKKNFLFLSILLLSSLSFACPACEGLYNEDSSHKEELNIHTNNNTEKEHFSKNNDFKEAMFEVNYNTPLWQKELGKNAIFPFFDYENKGNLEIKGAMKFDNKHILSVELNSNLNLIPTIYKNEDHVKNLKSFYDPYIASLNKKYENNHPLDKEDLQKATTEIYRRIGKIEENKIPKDKIVVSPVTIGFKNMKFAYEFMPDDNFKFSTNFKFDAFNHYSLNVLPSYDFSSFIPKNEYITFKNLALVSNYTFASKDLFSKISNRKKIDKHSILLGTDISMILPFDFTIGLDLKKLLDIEIKNAETKLFGEAKLSLNKDIKLYEKDSHKISMYNNFSWNPKWAWNDKSKTFTKYEIFDYVFEKDIKYKYPTKFISDKLEASSKLEYVYKINDDLSLNTNVKLKYVGLYDRLNSTSKRVNSFFPSAHVGLNYNHKFNNRTSLFAQLNTDFNTKDALDKKLYLIEPSAKVGIKYSY